MGRRLLPRQGEMINKNGFYLKWSRLIKPVLITPYSDAHILARTHTYPLTGREGEVQRRPRAAPPLLPRPARYRGSSRHLPSAVPFPFLLALC